MKQYVSLFLAFLLIITACGPSKPGGKGSAPPSTGFIPSNAIAGGNGFKLCSRPPQEGDIDGDCVNDKDDADPNDPNVGWVSKDKTDPRDWSEEDKINIEEFMKNLSAQGVAQPDDSGNGNMLTDGLLLILGMGVV